MRVNYRVARVLFSTFVLLLIAGLGSAITQNNMSPRPKSEVVPEILELISEYSEQVHRGAEAYDLICSNCHGNTGLGIEEGRAEFLPEHQRCEKCHRPFNSSKLSEVEISDKNAFNIGTPPALNNLSKFSSAAGLYASIKATMPRYAPGTLSEEQYLDITAFLSVLNGSLAKDITLKLDNLDEVLLEPIVK